ncbi:MAG: aspartyl protease family protein [Deltaproteobacteria bacterium]|nr:aspartyl protease family protein [Deltaproteobacteria bacterium]
MSLIGRFPFKRVGASYFGPIDRPLVPVDFRARGDTRIVPITMLVDTGADFTLLPLRYASLLGISLKTDCCTTHSQGIGGKETVHLLKDPVQLHIGKWSARIPLGLLARDDIPPLLGRIHCLERISLLMRRKVTVLVR